MWQPALEPGTWLRADAALQGRQRARRTARAGAGARTSRCPRPGRSSVLGITMLVPPHELPPPGHFPRAAAALAVDAGSAAARLRGETPRVLNLFAYTGAASLIAAQAGAEVTHVDASKRAIAWAKQNQAVSKLDEAPIRWILEDARKFVAREVRRGKSYHVILVDPPKFGRGPEGEVWDVFEHLAAAAARLRRPAGAGPRGAGAHHLRHPRLRAGHGRPRARVPRRRGRAPSRAGSWPWSSSPAGGCCRPRFTRAGRAMMPRP